MGENTQLPRRPVIFVANHGFYDDVLATILATKRHAYIYWGSLPQFYNTFDGLAASLIGEVIVNRKKQESRKASVAKALKVMEHGTDLIIFPEGVWNKTSEKLVLDLWRGVYKLSCMGKYDVIPIVHYVREPQIVNKKNIIHTVVDNPIHLYEMEEDVALNFLRDTLASWQYKMLELYGKSTRSTELNGYKSSVEKWNSHLRKRVGDVKWYDSTIEKEADFRRKDIVRPEDAFRLIANVKNISIENVKMVFAARDIVEKWEETDFQRLY